MNAMARIPSPSNGKPERVAIAHAGGFAGTWAGALAGPDHLGWVMREMKGRLLRFPIQTSDIETELLRTLIVE